MSLGCVYSNGLCARLSELTRLNRLNQRDLSLPDSIASSYNPGIDLNRVIFDKYGYVLNSTTIVRDILDTGLRRLYLDVYWDTQGSAWHVCPFPPPVSPPNASYQSVTATSLSATATGNKSAGVPLNSIPTGITFTATPQQNSTLRVNSTSSNDTSFNGTSPNATAVSGFNSTVIPPATGPDIFCDYRLDIRTLLEAIEDYITSSDTTIAASLLHLQLRPREWLQASANATDGTILQVPGVPSLTDALNSIIGSRLMTPGVLREDQTTRKEYTTDGVWSGTPRNQQWPELRSVLYTDKNRLLVSYSGNASSFHGDLNSLSSVAFNFNTTIKDPTSYSVEDLWNLSFVDSFVHNSDQWVATRNAGVSPVIAYGIDVYSQQMIDLFNTEGYWAWAPHQPPLYTIKQRERMLKNGYRDSEELMACAILTEAGMVVADCGRRFPVLCRNKENSFDWRVSNDNHSYFSPDCPKGYRFGVPSTPLEARFARELWTKTSASPAWVDFNSLFLPNCWVEGGTNAVCPYNVLQNDRNGIGYIAVAAAVAACLLGALFIFEWDRRRSPLMRNSRKKDRKGTDYEGVPA